MTSLKPRPEYSDEELAILYPPSLQLQQVQLILRHGERTPVNARFKNAGLHADWPYCEAARNFRDVILSADRSWDTLRWRRRLETFGAGDNPVLSMGPQGQIDAVCQPGELTDLGRQTTLALGERTRRLYVDQLGFLPKTLESGGTVHLRATPIQRALESVQQAFTCLYPSSARAPNFQPPDIVTRSFQDETLFPNEGGCKRFAELSAAFADRAAKLWNKSPEMAYINKRIGKWMPEKSPVIKVDSHPRLSGIMDTVNATLAHGPSTKLPKEFYDEKVVSNIDRICREEWFAGYQESQEYRTLGIGGLVGDVTQRMMEKAIGAAIPKTGALITLSGCHDTTLAGLLTALGAFEYSKNKWPNFTSSIAIELFQRKDTATTSNTKTASNVLDTSTSWWSSLFTTKSASTVPTARLPLGQLLATDKQNLGGYYVRLRYNDTPLTIPNCRPAGKHLDGDESFCTLAAFKEVADEFTPRNWKEQCTEHLGEPAMKSVIERPLGITDDVV
ncbi:putative histidine acid phosphatase family protein [Teratosphaeria destructans]|uniref:3-phytase n=1 Tax=Teratosphaeria destructans TaxID=418781 RepID=A0A9W7W3Z1_9PEZI|nr:putative histidine acid phosphatase family protein [Teratosphaeria destructans]